MRALGHGREVVAHIVADVLGQGVEVDEDGRVRDAPELLGGGRREPGNDVDVTLNTLLSTTDWASSVETSLTMLMSCVLVTKPIRWSAMTWVGSPALHSGVVVLPPPVSPTTPWQPNESAAHSGNTAAHHGVETDKRLTCRIEEPPTEGDTQPGSGNQPRRHNSRPAHFWCVG